MFECLLVLGLISLRRLGLMPAIGWLNPRICSAAIRMVSLILSLLRRIAYFVQICFLDQRDRLLDGDIVGFTVYDCERNIKYFLQFDMSSQPENVGFMNNFFQERLVLKTL